MRYVIETALPATDGEWYGAGRPKYPFSIMGIGEAFSIMPSDRERVRGSAKRYRRLNQGWDFMIGIASDGRMMLWRTA